MTAEAPAAPRTKECPYCAETIRAEAIKCRFCGSKVSGSAPGRLRSISSSPLLGFASLIIGLVAGMTEALSFVGVKADFITRKDKSENGGQGFAPALDSDDVRVVVLVAAIAIGAIGFAATLLARRRRDTAILLFLGAGVAGLTVGWVAGVNLALVALSVLLLLAAVTTAVASRPFALVREKSRRTDSNRGPPHYE